MKKKLVLAASLVISTNVMAFSLGDLGNAINSVQELQQPQNTQAQPTKTAPQQVPTTAPKTTTQQPASSAPKNDASKPAQSISEPKTSSNTRTQAQIDEEVKSIQAVFDKKTFNARLPKSVWVKHCEPEEVTQWIATLDNYKKILPDMITFIKDVAKTKKSDIDFQIYSNWLSKRVMDDIQSSIKDQQQTYKYEMEAGIRTYLNGEKAVKNAMRTQSNLISELEKYEAGLKSLNNQKAFDMAVYKKYSTSTAKFMKTYKTYGEKLKKARYEMVKKQRLPQAVSKDKKLLAIAHKLLKPLHKRGRNLGKISHMRIVKDLNNVKVLELVEGGYFNQRWQNFNVKFVEQVGKRYYIVFASFRNNISVRGGYASMGTGKWWLGSIGDVAHSSEILKKNLK
ncbi:MAG: hypothetical protein U9N30_10700 [Campylobacterota bacterium]|nr:hypothetical protein [Campylobacterota bacterium]